MAKVMKDVLMRGRKPTSGGWKWTKQHGDMMRAARRMIDALHEMREVLPTRPSQAVLNRVSGKVCRASVAYHDAMMSTVGPDFAKARDTWKWESKHLWGWSVWCWQWWRPIFDDVDRNGETKAPNIDYVKRRYRAAFEDMRDRMGWDVAWVETEDDITIKRCGE